MYFPWGNGFLEYAYCLLQSSSFWYHNETLNPSEGWKHLEAGCVLQLVNQMMCENVVLMSENWGRWGVKFSVSPCSIVLTEIQKGEKLVTSITSAPSHFITSNPVFLQSRYTPYKWVGLTTSLGSSHLVESCPVSIMKWRKVKSEIFYST